MESLKKRWKLNWKTWIVKVESLENLEVFDYDSRTGTIPSYLISKRAGLIEFMQVLGLLYQRPQLYGSVTRIITPYCCDW